MFVTDHEAPTTRSQNVSETALLEALKNNDTAAYKALYQAHVGRVYALCFRLLGGDDALAEDATQEVFIQVWKSVDTFEQRSQFATWLHRVAANTCITYLRKQKNWFEKIFLLEHNSATNMANSEANELDLNKL